MAKFQLTKLKEIPDYIFRKFCLNTEGLFEDDLITIVNEKTIMIKLRKRFLKWPNLLELEMESGSRLKT